jgi:hypothetical protein
VSLFHVAESMIAAGNLTTHSEGHSPACIQKQKLNSEDQRTGAVTGKLKRLFDEVYAAEEIQDRHQDKTKDPEIPP